MNSDSGAKGASWRGSPIRTSRSSPTPASPAGQRYLGRSTTPSSSLSTGMATSTDSRRASRAFDCSSTAVAGRARAPTWSCTATSSRRTSRRLGRAASSCSTSASPSCSGSGARARPDGAHARWCRGADAGMRRTRAGDRRASTATDVYALGVLLYCCSPGYIRRARTCNSPADLVKAIVDTEPQRPSAVVDSDSATECSGGVPARARPAPLRSSRTPRTSAKRGHTTPGRLRRTSAGRARHHPQQGVEETGRSNAIARVTALVDDLQRYLDSSGPISARPDSLRYRHRQVRAQTPLGRWRSAALAAAALGRRRQSGLSHAGAARQSGGARRQCASRLRASGSCRASKPSTI